MKSHWIIFFIFGILVFYSLKFIISRIKIKENLINFCTPIFTANGTVVTISPLMNFSKYLSVDLNSSKNNVILSSKADTWVFEKIINKISLDKSIGNLDGLSIPQGYGNNYTDENRCSVYIKTKSSFQTTEKDNGYNYLYYYITTNPTEDFVPGLGNSYISASLFGKSTNQVWYIIDIAELPTKTDNPQQKNIIDIANKARTSENDNTKYVYIINKSINNPTFLTANSLGGENNYLGTATLLRTPTLDSIWKINITQKTTPETTMYKPTLAIGEFPNNDNKLHSTFMSFFLPMWNRQWYINKDGKLTSFTINLTFESIINGEYNVTNTFATGDVLINNIKYKVRTYGSDMIYGSANAYDTNNNNKIILKMVPQNKKPKDTIPEGILMLQGWIEDSNGNINSICASNEKYLTYVCISKPPFQIDPNIILSEKFTLEKYGCASQSLGNLNNCVR